MAAGPCSTPLMASRRARRFGSPVSASEWASACRRPCARPRALDRRDSTSPTGTYIGTAYTAVASPTMLPTATSGTA